MLLNLLFRVGVRVAASLPGRGVVVGASGALATGETDALRSCGSAAAAHLLPPRPRLPRVPLTPPAPLPPTREPQTLLNFFTGMCVSVFVFLFSLPSLIWSYQAPLVRPAPGRSSAEPAWRRACDGRARAGGAAPCPGCRILGILKQRAEGWPDQPRPPLLCFPCSGAAWPSSAWLLWRRSASSPLIWASCLAQVGAHREAAWVPQPGWAGCAAAAAPVVLPRVDPLIYLRTHPPCCTHHPLLLPPSRCHRDLCRAFHGGGAPAAAGRGLRTTPPPGRRPRAPRLSLLAAPTFARVPFSACATLFNPLSRVQHSGMMWRLQLLGLGKGRRWYRVGALPGVHWASRRGPSTRLADKSGKMQVRARGGGPASAQDACTQRRQEGTRETRRKGRKTTGGLGSVAGNQRGAEGTGDGAGA